MRILERPYRSLAKLYEAELAYFELMHRENAAVAVLGAITYCNMHSLNFPPWLAQAVLRKVWEELAGKPPKARGRTSDPLMRYQQDYIHYGRWSAVDEVLEARGYLDREISTLATLPGSRARQRLRDVVEFRHGLGTDNLAAFEIVSERLSFTIFAGSPDTIKKSYQVVQRSYDDPSGAARYRCLHPRLLEAIEKYITDRPKAHRTVKVKKSSTLLP